MGKLISIIIPCYNIAAHIEKCVESCLAQTYTNFELILVNDGSTDQTGMICDGFSKKDLRITVLHQQNGGVSSARNVGIEKAKGEILCFIDGDDLIKENYLEKLVEDFAEKTWPLCGMINVKNGNEKENQNYAKLLSLYPSGDLGKNKLLDLLEYSSLSSPCARIYSKKIILDHHLRFDTNVTYQEDLLFNLQYVQFIEKIKILNYYGYYYIEHSNSSTGRFHANFEHIPLLFKELKKYVFADSDKVVLQEFILQTILRKISNVFHGKSPKTKQQKKNEIKGIFKSDYFQFSVQYLNKLNINFVLKLLLKTKNVSLIYTYFTMLHK